MRPSLYTRELTIDGIKPPPHSVAFSQYTTSIAAQVRPVVPTLSNIGMTQVRMVPQPAARPTQMQRHPAPVRIQGQINVPRMVNSQMRTSSGAIIQQHPANVQIQSHPPALHPVSQNTFAPGGAQVIYTPADLVFFVFWGG